MSNRLNIGEYNMMKNSAIHSQESFEETIKHWRIRQKMYIIKELVIWNEQGIREVYDLVTTENELRNHANRQGNR